MTDDQIKMMVANNEHLAAANLVLSQELTRVRWQHQQTVKQLHQRIEQAESRYQRDVHGLNNEGDVIGGEPAGGYINDLRHALRRVQELESVRASS